jgi:GH25 family lysozyme M1 (1,4-beta-N-acetylmuramidase)
MTVKGFDFSSWQDAPDTPAFIDFTKAVAIGAKFAVARAAYGLSPDRIFPRGYDDSVKVGLITGVYQFVDYRVSAKQNWAYLTTKLAGRKPAFIGLDLEQNEAYWPGGWPKDTSHLTDFCFEYYDEWKESNIGCPLLLYTNPSTIKQMRLSTALKSLSEVMPLWVAWYSLNEPQLESIAPWTRYHIWQPTPSAVGHAYGMESGNVDTDTWNGTLEELQAFVKNAPVVIPPVVPSTTGALAELMAWASKWQIK